MVSWISSAFRRLPRDRPALGLAAGGAFFILASMIRWLLGGISEGFGPMTFLPAILLSGLFGGIRIGIAVRGKIAGVRIRHRLGLRLLIAPRGATQSRARARMVRSRPGGMMRVSDRGIDRHRREVRLLLRFGTGK